MKESKSKKLNTDTKKGEKEKKTKVKVIPPPLIKRAAPKKAPA